MAKLPPSNKPAPKTPTAPKAAGSKPKAATEKAEAAPAGAADVVGVGSDDDDDDDDADPGQRLAIPLKEANRLRRMATRLEKKGRAIIDWQKTELVDTSVVGKSLQAVAYTLTEAARSLESLPTNYKRGPGGGGGPAKPVEVGSKVHLSNNKRVLARYEGLFTQTDVLEVTGLRRDGKDVVAKTTDGTTVIIPRAHLLVAGQPA